jgi:arsenite methyltransferase
MVTIETIHFSNKTKLSYFISMRTSTGTNGKLREAVCQVYSAAAQKPAEEETFPLGRDFAESLGYPPDLLAGMPAISVDAFTGVSNVSLFADIPTGTTVLDLGCGAGLDSLIASGRVGSTGKVIGVDFSDAMLARARKAAAEYGVNNVEFRHADAEDLRIAEGTIDIALVNGIFNLNPDREAIFRELARVLRPGGGVYAAELILREPLPAEILKNPGSWFS